MQDFKRGTARANQLNFEYLTEGDGPLALCVHGFPRLALQLPLPAPGAELLSRPVDQDL